jgi:hypothetical protein
VTDLIRIFVTLDLVTVCPHGKILRINRGIFVTSVVGELFWNPHTSSKIPVKSYIIFWANNDRVFFNIRALDGDAWSTLRPGRLPPGKETRYSLHRRLGWPHGRSRQLRNISPISGFDSRTVQPVASRYTYFSPNTSLPYVLHFPDAYAQ